MGSSCSPAPPALQDYCLPLRTVLALSSTSYSPCSYSPLHEMASLKIKHHIRCFSALSNMLREVSHLTSAHLLAMSTVSHVSVDINWWFLDPQGSCDHMPGAQESPPTVKRVLLQVSHASPGKVAGGLQIAENTVSSNNILLQLLCGEYPWFLHTLSYWVFQ